MHEGESVGFLVDWRSLGSYVFDCDGDGVGFVLACVLADGEIFAEVAVDGVGAVESEGRICGKACDRIGYIWSWMGIGKYLPRGSSCDYAS